MLGSADVVQMLLLSSHGGRLQRFCVALQWIQLFPFTVHVVFMTLQIRRLKLQSDTELTTGKTLSKVLHVLTVLQVHEV